jgi:hypothetical protein
MTALGIMAAVVDALCLTAGAAGLALIVRVTFAGMVASTARHTNRQPRTDRARA